MNQTNTSVGHDVPRIDGGEKTTGSASYIDDMAVPGMLFGAMAFSDYAHARILSYDTSEALKLPGVKAVITGEDFDSVLGGVFLKDEPPIATGKVRYLGEPVAAVAATDLKTARLAAQLINIEYEALPNVLSIDEALDPKSALIHEELADYFRLKPSNFEGNMLWEASISEGDVDQAWSECDVIVEGEFQTQAQHHLYMEPCGALAVPEQNGRLTLWSSCQSVFIVQQKVADYLGIPMAKVRALVPHVGGGFGGKGGLHVQTLVAKLAMVSGRPVKMTLTRTEDFEIVRSRHPIRIRMKTGAKNDGTLVARELELVLDGGAYADESPAVLNWAVFVGRGPYNIPNVRSHGQLVYTNKLRAGPYRGFGNPQVTLAGESQIDEIADKLGMDGIKLRQKNACKTGDDWIGGQKIEACGFNECITRIVEATADVDNTNIENDKPNKRRGIGYSALTHMCGIQSTSAEVHLRADGSVAVVTGVVDIGQGSNTILSQIVADSLAISVDQVSFAAPDTDSSPYNWKTAASRTTYMSGRSVLGAAEGVREQLFKHASEMMECAEHDLELRVGGLVGVKGAPESQLSFSQIAGRAMARVGGPITGIDTLVFDGPTLDPKRAIVDGFAFTNVGIYTFGMQAVEVEVDTDTGEVKVLRVWSAHDVGRAINPVMVDGQVQGGVVQGLGLALTEEMVWGENGNLVNPTLMDYKIPGILDVPDIIESIIIETPEPSGPYGAKGVGENSLCGIPAAVANAIANATGIRVRSLPFTSERVLMALEAKSN
jgi:CO/xanthine dehydrogenase Mo-binding subunit